MLKTLTNLKAYAKYIIFYISIFFVIILAQTNLKTHVYFYFFYSDTLYVLISFSIEGLLAFDKILWELLSGFLVEPIWDLSRYSLWRLPWLIFPLSKWHHPNSVTCIKRSALCKNYIIWYQSFDSCYRFYPIQFFSLRNLSQVHVLFCYLCYGFHLVAFLFPSYCILVCILICVLVLVTFRFCVKKKISIWILLQSLLQILLWDNLAYWKNLGV